MEPQDIAAALDELAAKWEAKRSEYWANYEQFLLDQQAAAQGGNTAAETRYSFNATKYERMAGLAKEASTDAWALAARVRGLVPEGSTL